MVSDKLLVNNRRKLPFNLRTAGMNMNRIIHSLLLPLAILVLLFPSMPVVAQENTIELEATYPKVENALPKAIFKFPISLTYRGAETRDFDLQVIGPLAWETYVTSGDEGVRVSVIKLRPNMEYPNHIMIVAAAPDFSPVGEYKVTLIISSGVLQDSIDLTAVVMPRYSLRIIPGRSSHYAIIANQDNHLSITIENNGSSELTDIKLSVDSPKEWSVCLAPDSIQSLPLGVSRDVQITIKPSTKVNNRSYRIILTAKAAQTTQETVADFYFDVEEPQAPWMWIGGIIVLAAISIFTYIFIKMDRKKEVT